MHFVCSTFGSSGDVFPFLGLALELRRRGHEITFAVNEHYASLVAEYGLRFEPIGSSEDFEACLRDPDLWHPKRSFRHVVEFLHRGMERHYQIHAEAAGDAIGLTTGLGLGALVAQDRLERPILSVHLQPAVLWSDRAPPTLPGLRGPRWLKSLLFRLAERTIIDPAIGPFLNDWRRELGLPPVRRIARWWHSRSGVVCLFPEWFAPPQDDWPAGVVQADFPLWNHRPDGGLAPEVEGFLRAGEPPLAFAPGSKNSHGRPFFEAAVEACAALGRRGLLLTEYPESLPGHLPPSVAHVHYAPFDLLLPRTAAFVHHGGVGSTSQAMLAGIPQLAMPMAHDQFDNAERVRRLGLGDWLPVRRFGGRRVASRLARLLASTSVAAACRDVAGRLAPRDGLARAATAIERRSAELLDPARGSRARQPA